MSVGDAVAIYAALVGTASLGWQVYRAQRADRPRIDVRVRVAMIGTPSGLLNTIVVEAVNRGDRSVSIRSAGLELQLADGSRCAFLAAGQRPIDSIPGTVAPDHHLERHFERAAVEGAGFDPSRPLIGYVNLATGVVIRSEPTIIEGALARDADAT